MGNTQRMEDRVVHTAQPWTTVILRFLARGLGIRIPMAADQVFTLRIEHRSPVCQGVGIKFVEIALRIENIDAVGYLVICGPVNFDASLDGAEVSVDEMLLCLHLPTEMIKTCPNHAASVELDVPANTHRRTVRQFGKTDVVMRIPVGEESCPDPGLPSNFFQAADLVVELDRPVEIAHE